MTGLNHSPRPQRELCPSSLVLLHVLLLLLVCLSPHLYLLSSFVFLLAFHITTYLFPCFFLQVFSFMSLVSFLFVACYSLILFFFLTFLSTFYSLIVLVGQSICFFLLSPMFIITTYLKKSNATHRYTSMTFKVLFLLFVCFLVHFLSSISHHTIPPTTTTTHHDSPAPHHFHTAQYLPSSIPHHHSYHLACHNHPSEGCHGGGMSDGT